MSKLITRCLGALFAAVLWAGGGTAFAFTPPAFITTTFQGCRNDGSIHLPIGGKFICPDSAYTTGNLGKGWNELDLVPFRLTTASGSQSGVTTTYGIYIAADYQQSGPLGYDVVSVPVLNAAKSHASCTVSAGAQTTVAGITGGTDVTVYRELTIHQNANTTCVFDWYKRLALGAAQFNGSNLQAYIFDQANLSGGKKTIPIPVKEIAPQELRKDMSATIDSNVTWNLTKAADTASINFGNVCAAPDGPLTKQVKFTVTWTKTGTTAGGVTFTTNVYAKNPASRTITVNVTDNVYKGTTQTTLLDTKSSGAVDVAANTELLVLTHTKTITDGSAGGLGDSLNDVATASYTDKDTGIAIPGNTTAVASTTIGAGAVTDSFAAIADSESISGTGLTFAVAQPAIGQFSGYTAGTQTVGPVDWGITGETTSNQVDFFKTVRLDAHRVTSGTLTDTAVLVASPPPAPDGFSTQAGPVNVTITSSAAVKLTISKTIPLNNVLVSGQRIEVSFHITGSGSYQTDRTLTFGPGDTTKSVELTGLDPDTYTVTEVLPALFFSSPAAVGVNAGLQPVGGNAQTAALVADSDGVFRSGCAGTTAFTNGAAGGPVFARVQKITDPVLASNDPDYNWTFTLNGPGVSGVTATAQAGNGFVTFQAVLQEGTYTVTETQKTPAWVLTGATPDTAPADKVCDFTVTLVDLNSGTTFSCTFSNQKQGKARVVKTVQGAPPSGTQAFTFQLRQGASATQVGTTLGSLIANASNGGTINFASYLVPGNTYQLCEIVMPGWLTSLGTFVPNSFMPPDGVAVNPTVDNSILCGNFTVAAGETKTFTVDNTPPPGGRALTIGFWKNWASCASSGGGQKPVLDQTLALAEPTGIVVSAQSGTYPAFAATYYLVLHGSTSTPNVAPSCQNAVRLLNKSTIGAGTKSASDPAFNLAAQLVAAELNYAAGAGKTGAATTAINQAVVLLGKYAFNGNTHTKISAADAATMNNLATILDNYNNNR